MEVVQDVRAEGFVGFVVFVGVVRAVLAVDVADAADTVVSAKADSVWPAVFLQVRLQHGRHWCTEPLGLYSSMPLQMESKK